MMILLVQRKGELRPAKVKDERINLSPIILNIKREKQQRDDHTSRSTSGRLETHQSGWY